MAQKVWELRSNGIYPLQNIKLSSTPMNKKRKLTPEDLDGDLVCFGLSTGLNNFTSLLGLSMDIRIKDKLYTRMGIGAGSWGLKYATGIKYNLSSNMRFSKGWSFAVGYSHSVGLKNITIGESDSTTIASNTTTTKGYATIDCLPADAINLSFIRSNFLGHRKTIYFELGYSIPLQKQPWVVKKTDGQFPQSLIKFIQPGGLIIGLGFNFGLL